MSAKRDKDNQNGSVNENRGGYVLNPGRAIEHGQLKRSGILLLVAIGVVVAGLIGSFIYLGEEAAQPFLLFVLGGLAVIGIFTLFAAAVGLLKFGGQSHEDGHEYRFLEALEDAHVLTDGSGRLLYADTTYAHLIGAVSAQDIRSVDRVFGVEEGQPGPVFRLSVAAEEERSAREEVRLEHGIGGNGTGAPRWYNLSVHPLDQTDTTKSDSSARTLWQVVDITQDRQDQEAAFQELQNVINYLDHAPAGFFSAKSDGKVMYINATLASWLGLDLTEFQAGELHLQDIVRGDGVALLNAARAAPGQVRTETIDVDFVKKNGQSLAVRLLHSTPFKSDGAPGPTRTVVLNRSNMAADESDLADGGAQFARFFNSAPIAIAGLNKHGALVRVNAAFVHLFKTSKSECEKAALVDLIFEGEHEKLNEAIKSAAEGQGEILPVDAALSDDADANVQLFLSAMTGDGPQDGEPGEEEVMVVYAIDTTQQRTLEQQFAQSQKMQAIGQLAGGIAHDFNNMLTAIIGFSDLLLQNHGPSDPSFQDIMNIKNNANRAAGLVRQLLAFSRRQTLRPTVIDLRDVVEDLSILLERLLGENVRLNVTHGRDLWAVKADINQLEQVVINLSVNARDAMPDGGTLSISTRNLTPDDCDDDLMKGLVPAEYAELVVADSGTGMTAEVMEKIFEPFFSTKAVGEGTGLGLATVYGIIKQTGGYIYPVSEVGKGTTFHILLPRHVVQEEEKTEKITVEGPRDLSGSARILLVEDEEAVRAFSARALQARGHTVYEASSGVHALEVMTEIDGKIDLVVSDVVMPEMDGPTLLGELRKIKPELKIIFVSGYAEEAFEKHLAEGEKFAFLPKPFSLKQLATKVKEVLDGVET